MNIHATKYEKLPLPSCIRFLPGFITPKSTLVTFYYFPRLMLHLVDRSATAVGGLPHEIKLFIVSPLCLAFYLRVLQMASALLNYFLSLWRKKMKSFPFKL